MNLKPIGYAAGLLSVASLAGMSARLATCKKDAIPEGATAMIQGDTFTMAPCPIFLMEEDDSVRGGFFRSTFLNKLGSIDKDGSVNYLGGMYRGSGNEEGNIRGSKGTIYGRVKDNGRLKNNVGDEVATLYTIDKNGTKTPGVEGAQKKALGVFGLGI